MRYRVTEYASAMEFNLITFARSRRTLSFTTLTYAFKITSLIKCAKTSSTFDAHTRAAIYPRKRRSSRSVSTNGQRQKPGRSQVTHICWGFRRIVHFSYTITKNAADREEERLHGSGCEASPGLRPSNRIIEIHHLWYSRDATSKIFIKHSIQTAHSIE